MSRLTKSFSVFDCDAHINDPTQIWDYVPESQQELVRNTYWRGESEAGLTVLGLTKPADDGES